MADTGQSSSHGRWYVYDNKDYTTNEWVDMLTDLFGSLLGSFYEQTDPVDDIDRIYRQEEAQAFQALLEDIRNGEATWRDIANFDVYYLAEVDGFQEYVDSMIDSAMYKGLYDDIAAANGDPEILGSIFEEYDNAGIETNPYIQQDLASTGSAVSVITGTVDNAILDDAIRRAAIGDGILGGEVDFEDLPGYGGIWDGLIRHIKVIGKGLSLPIPDWLPLPGIFELPTVGEIFDTVTGPWKEAAQDALNNCVTMGKTASECMEEQSVIDILTDGIGNATEQIWDKTSETVQGILDETIDCVSNPSTCAQEVFDKIKDIFGEGAVDPTSTGGNIPDWMKVIIIGGAYGDEILGELEDLFGGDIDGDELVGPPEDPTVTPPVTPEFDCASVGREQVAGATTAEECGPLIAPYGYCEDGTTIKTDDLGTNCEEYAPNGFCEDGVTKKDNPEGTNCEEYEPPLSAEEQQCNEQGRVFNDITQACEETCANPEHVVGADGSCGPPEVTPEPCANNATTESGCERCSDNSLPSEHENGDCSQPKIVTETPPSDFDCNQPRPDSGFAVQSWDRYCSPTRCLDGTVKADPEGTNCPEYVAPEVEQPEEASPCDQQNRVTREDGSCGECLPGFTPDPEGFDQCIQAPPECNDCSCAEYAAANPVECTQCPEGQSYCESTGQCEAEGACPAAEEAEEGSAGGGGGGGGGGGMLTGEPLDLGFDIAGDPTLLARTEFPITDFLAGIFTNSTGGRNV